jgi:hypothetical protein
MKRRPANRQVSETTNIEHPTTNIQWFARLRALENWMLDVRCLAEAKRSED